jgi:hypothetical protein
MTLRVALAVGAVSLSLGLGANTGVSRASEAGNGVSADEQAVYEAVLDGWLESSSAKQLINQWLDPRPSSSDPEYADCAKGLSLVDKSDDSPAKSLLGVKFKRNGLELVDGRQWSAEDPENSIRRGNSVNSAVDQGISHSLITLSQITFSSNGNDALVKFSMVCGRLCGSGSTLQMHKSNGHWKSVKRCGGWIS